MAAGKSDPVVWRKAAACGNGECVEVAARGRGVLVRNSERPSEVVEFTASEWGMFAAALRGGEFGDLG